MIAFIIFFVIHTIHGVPTGQYFISTPANLTVNSGSHARLSCRVGNLVGTCEWTRDGFSLGTDRNLGGYSRYLMPGQRQDICDLSIDPVLPIDEGLYQCQVSGGHGVPPIASSPVSLSVNSEPGKPYIMQAMEEEMMEVQEGEEVELQCESQGGRPPAEIQWWDGEGRRIVSDVTEHVKRMEDTKMFKTVSTVIIKSSEYSLIKCSAHNEVFPAGRMSDAIQIETVNHQPVVVHIKQLEEGDSVKIVCQGRENSRFSRFKWFINDVEIFDEDQNILELQKFTKSFDNSHIRCFTEDIIGQSNLVKEVKLVLKEKYNIGAFSNLIGHPSVSKSKPKGRKNKMKKRTMLLCDMEDDASEEPSHVFIPKISSNMKSNELIIATDKKNKYKCKIVLQGLDIINKMSKDISSITNSMTQISKSLDEFNSNLIEEQDAFSH